MRDAVNRPATADLDDVEAGRAQEYALFAVLLADPPTGDLLARLAVLPGDASPLGFAHAALARAAATTDAARAKREFFKLFVGVGRGELLPYGSYYLTDMLHDRPLARLRSDLARLGIAKTEGCAEPEDHAALLCDIMAGLIDGRFAAPPGADRQIFATHLAPWMGRFFAELQTARSADFYRSVGALGSAFMAIESEAFTLAA